MMLVVLMAASFLSFGEDASAQSSSPQTHIVTMRQMQFDPPTLSVAPGDTVEWKNEDIYAHTVTADDNSFDSGPIQPGTAWKMTFQHPATVGYHCRPHPNMKAKLVVAQLSEKTADASSGQSLRFIPPTKPQELHPILVNFTAALLPLAFLSDVLGIFAKRRSLNTAAFWLTFYAALITPLTAIAGWWWKHAVGPDLPARIILIHQWLGTSAVFLFAILVFWRWKFYKRDVPPSLAYLALAALAVLALIYQGSLGGRMVFGG
jgi:plastocyanin/uncharacterized membrane protein